MMAAYTAAQNGADVTLFERNEKLGKKMYISGKGRCNLTNDCTPQDFLQNVVNFAVFVNPIDGVFNDRNYKRTYFFLRENA